MRSFNYSEYVEIDCREFGYDKAERRRDTRGGIIISKDKFKEFVRSKGADDKVS